LGVLLRTGIKFVGISQVKLPAKSVVVVLPSFIPVKFAIFLSSGLIFSLFFGFSGFFSVFCDYYE
jgi:hypothetical protein